MSRCTFNDGRPTLTAGETIEAGAVCLIKNGKLATWKTADDTTTASLSAQVFFAMFDAEAGEHVAAMIAGNAPGTILAPAAAGTYVAGAPVYAANGGKVAASGVRVVGTAMESATLAAAGTVHVVPLHVPAEPAAEEVSGNNEQGS